MWRNISHVHWISWLAEDLLDSQEGLCCMRLGGIKVSPLNVMKAFRRSPPYVTSVFRSCISAKQFFFLQLAPNFLLRGWKRSETKVAEGYYWAITETPIRLCCGLSGSIKHIQSAPGVKATTSGFNSRADAESKTSYTHGSISQRFRSYEILHYSK